jgi:hypothetical protein
MKALGDERGWEIQYAIDNALMRTKPPSRHWIRHIR